MPSLERPSGRTTHAHAHTRCCMKSVKAVGPLFSWCKLTEIGLRERESGTQAPMAPWLEAALGDPWQHLSSVLISLPPRCWGASSRREKRAASPAHSDAPWLAPAVSQRPEDGESGPMEESPWRSAAVFTCSGFTPPPLSLLPLSARLPTPAKTTARERERKQV